MSGKTTEYDSPQCINSPLGFPITVSYWPSFPRNNHSSEINEQRFSQDVCLPHVHRLQHQGRDLIKRGFKHNLNKHTSYKQTTRPITAVLICRAKHHPNTTGAGGGGRRHCCFDPYFWTHAPSYCSMGFNVHLRGNPKDSHICWILSKSCLPLYYWTYIKINMTAY